MTTTSDVYFSVASGRTAYVIPTNYNGQVAFDGGIQPVVIPANVNLAQDTDLLLSGTFGKMTKNANNLSEFSIAAAASKGDDVEYALLSKEKGIFVCYDKTNTDISYFYYKNGARVQFVKLIPGLRFLIKSVDALDIGDYAVNAYDEATMGECSIKEAETGDTAFLLVEKGCEANGIAQVVVIGKKVIS